MRKVHPAQWFIIGLKSFHLDPDLVRDPTGMLRTRTLHKVIKVLGSISQLWLFQRRRGKGREGAHRLYKDSQRHQSRESDLASVTVVQIIWAGEQWKTAAWRACSKRALSPRKLVLRSTLFLAAEPRPRPLLLDPQVEPKS